MKPKIIFIHGMFLTARSWEPWQHHFDILGYETEAPPWPFHDAEPSRLRAKIPAALGQLTLADLHSYYRGIVEQEETPPIVIGHSLGGLLAQKLAADGLVSAAIGIASVAPNRMLAFDWGFLRNSASITNPFAGDDPYEITPEGFHHNFANTLGVTESNALYTRYAVHESRQVLRGILGAEGHIDTTLPHPPLLLIGAEHDAIIPAALVRRNAHAYTDEGSHHEYLEMRGRDHLLCNTPGWEEIADTIAAWVDAYVVKQERGTPLPLSGTLANGVAIR